MNRAVVVLLAVFLTMAMCAQVRAQDELVVRREAKLLEEPSQDALILDVITPGMRVELLETQGNWARIRIPVNAETGWVEKGYLLAGGGGSAAGIQTAESARMTNTEFGQVEDHIDRLRKSMTGIEYRVEAMVGRMEDMGLIEKPAPAVPAPRPANRRLTAPAAPAEDTAERMVPDERQSPAGLDSDYRWRNRFYMGKYFRGGEDFFGISAGRYLDSAHMFVVEGEVHYGIGDNRSKSDDMVEWGAGLNFNIKPYDFLIYPFVGVKCGMRHQLSTRARYLALTPSFGINAELGRIFAISATAREVFLYSDEWGDTEDTRLDFSFSYSY